MPLKPVAYPRGYPRGAPLRYTKALITNIRLERFTREKSFGSFRIAVSDEEKSFTPLTIIVNLTKLSFTTDDEVK